MVQWKDDPPPKNHGDLRVCSTMFQSIQKNEALRSLVHLAQNICADFIIWQSLV